MSQRHLIRLLDEDRSQWLMLDRDGRALSGPQDGLPAQPAEETIVLVPSDVVLLLEAPRIVRQRRRLEQAIAFVIEDQLVAPVEQAHVAILDDRGPDAVLVGVVARGELEAWLARLAATGIHPDRLLPEAVLLPAEPRPTLLLDGPRACLRYSATGALSGSLAEVAGWRELLGGQDDALDWSIIAAHAQEHMPDWSAGTQVSRVEVANWLANRLAQVPPAANLLAGPYAPRRRPEAASRLWQFAAGLAVAAVLVAMLSMALERWQLDRVQAEQRQQMEALLRETLPGIERVVDPRAQMLGEFSRQQGRSANAGVLAMLTRIAPLLAGGSRYVPESVEYRGGTLDFSVRSPDVATLDELRERIASLGYAVELSSMVPGSGGVEGKLRIRGNGA